MAVPALTRARHVVEMYRGEVFFEYNYSYHDNGRLKSARVARAAGRGS